MKRICKPRDIYRSIQSVAIRKDERRRTTEGEVNQKEKKKRMERLDESDGKGLIEGLMIDDRDRDRDRSMVEGREVK